MQLDDIGLVLVSGLFQVPSKKHTSRFMHPPPWKRSGQRSTPPSMYQGCSCCNRRVAS